MLGSTFWRIECSSKHRYKMRTPLGGSWHPPPSASTHSSLQAIKSKFNFCANADRNNKNGNINCEDNAKEIGETSGLVAFRSFSRF